MNMGLHRWAAMLLLLACGGTAMAEDGLSLSCPACHRGPASSIPTLDRLSVRQIAQALREFRDGSRAGIAMPRLVGALSDAEIERLAQRFGSAQP